MISINKKIASILVTVAMLLQCVPYTSFASDDALLLVNESFNGFVTNEVPSTLSIIGNRSYVAQCGEKNKAYRFELGAMAQSISWAANLSGECFISFDLSSDNKLGGKLALAKGTSSMNLISFENGRLRSHNGKQVSAVSSKVKNFVVQLDFDTASYSVYENGKEVISDCYISAMKIKSADKVSFEFTSKHNATADLDNVNIGLGQHLKSGYPTGDYNEASVERVEYEPVIAEETFLNVNMEKGSKLSAAYGSKDNILEQSTDEEGNGCVVFERTAANDFHLDIYTAAYPSDSIVYQHDVKLLSKDVTYTSYLIAGNGNSELYSVNSGVLTAGTKTAALKVDKWHTISSVYDVYNGTVAVYLDNKLVGDNLPASPTYSHAEAQKWRLHANRRSGDDKFYVDNIAIYGGKEPRSLENQGTVISGATLYENENTQKAFLKDKVSYHLRSGVLYANGNKEIIKPVVENGTTYVPAEFFEKAFGLEAAFDKTNGTAAIGEFTLTAGSDKVKSSSGEIILSSAVRSIDGVFEIPLKSFAVECMGKSVQYDNSATGGGFIIIADTEAQLPPKPDLQKLNDFMLYLRPSKEKIASDFEASGKAEVHPRVLADAEDFARIRSLAETDERMKLWAKAYIAMADELCKNPTPLIYELRDNVRLLYVSYDMIDHMFALGMAYQLTGDKKYAERAWIDLESVGGFVDWHPQHGLDVGAMACGYAVGYDWMYDAFTSEQRTYIEEGAMNCGISAYTDGYQKRNTYMVNSLLMDNNWAMVMNGGATMLAAAFYDAYPEHSAFLFSSAIRGIEVAIDNYAPDGGWSEGMGYAGMTLEYLTYQLASLKDIFGTVYTIDAAEGLDGVPKFYLYMQSPQGCFGYNDGASQNIHFDAGVLWVGDHYKDYGTLKTYSELFGFGNDVRCLLWYNPDKLTGATDLSLDKLYASTQVLTMRDSWDKNDHEVFAGVKGYVKDLGHGHLDHGAFMFYSCGTQWTHDFGSENYNVPGYWAGETPDAARWQYYRVRAEGHNTLIINPDQDAEFDPASTAYFVKLETKPRGVIGVVDLTDANMGKAKSVQRGVYFAEDRRSLVIRDEIVTKNESTMYWFLHTQQNAELTADGKGVILTDKNNSLNYVNLDFACNKPYDVSIRPSVPLDTSPHPDGMTNDSATKVIVLKVVADGEVNITAKLTPGTLENAKPVSEFDMPMSAWAIPDGELPETPVLDSLTIDGIEYDVSQKNIIHLTAEGSVGFADIDARSERFDVETVKPQTTDDIAVINVYNKNDRSFKTTYKVAYKIFKLTGIEGINEYTIAKLQASAEPQSENNAMNLLDRDLGTRWSASGAQNIVLDMGKQIDFNTVYMAFMDGSSRKYSVTIAVSDDGIEYREVYSGASSGASDNYEAFGIGECKARYIKISGNGWTGGAWNSWTEVAVAKK